MEPKNNKRTFDALPWVYIIIIIACAVSTAILLYIVVQNQHKIRKQAVASKNLGLRIQQERSRSVFRSCRDQNQRHTDAINALYTLLKKSGVPQKRRKAAAKPAVTFINALAPHHNCYKLLERTVPTHPPINVTTATTTILDVPTTLPAPRTSTTSPRSQDESQQP